MKNEKTRKAAGAYPDPAGPGNIPEVFSRLEDISRLLGTLLPQMERLTELMENAVRISAHQTGTGDTWLKEKLAELLSIARQTHQNSDFVRMVFTREKPKTTRKKADRSEQVKEYLRKYNRSMKL